MFAKLSRYQIQSSILLGVLIGILILGLTFRLIDLEHKVFWVDEVATVLRAAGYTKSEITQRLANGIIHSPTELLSFQQLTPERSLADAVRAFHSSPEHAPLYFLLIRFWMQLFGSSVTAVRGFSVMCSLLLLPGIYWLSQLLFGRRMISWIAVMLTALSPLLIAYSQEARPYSLWLLLLLLSSASLVQALRCNRLSDWGLYALTLTLSLYTSLLTIGIAIAQFGYVWMHEYWQLNYHQSNHLQMNQRVYRAGVAFFSAMLVLAPWLWLVSQRWQTLQANTTWMRLPMENFARGVIWFYSLAIVYFDVPVVTDPIWVAASEVVTATGVVILISIGFYQLCRQSPRIWLLVISLSLPVPLLLVLVDLMSNGRYSTAPRYMLPFHLGTQLAVAYLLVNQMHEKAQWRWRGIALFLVAVCLDSNFSYLNTSPKYLKNRNLHNLPIAYFINQTHQSLLLSESTNTLDLLSLSHSLDSDVQLKILPAPELIQQLNQAVTQASIAEQAQPTFLFNPSPMLQQQLQLTALQLEEVYHPQTLTRSEFALSLWQFQPRRQLHR
jgi:uncharacterized membrane protein